MGFVEQMKWWHWTLLSLVIGALLAYTNTGGADTSVDHSSCSPGIFEGELLLPAWVDPKNSSRRMPLVGDIVVHPVEPVIEGGKSVNYQLISFTMLTSPTPQNPSGSKDTEFMLAPYPYEPAPRRNASRNNAAYPAASVYHAVAGDTLGSVAHRFYPKDPAAGEKAFIQTNPVLREAKGPADLKIVAGRYYWVPWDPADQHNVNDFIEAANQFLKARDGTGAIPISIHYRWWENQKYGYQMWIGGSFLIVGVLWPMLLTVMLKGGLGSMTEEEFSLRKYKSKPEPAMAKPAPTGPTAGDMQRLRELEETLSASLKAGATAAPAAEATATPAEAPVKKLTGTAAETPVAPKVEEEKKDFAGGVYYPVELPHTKPKQ